MTIRHLRIYIQHVEARERKVPHIANMSLAKISPKEIRVRHSARVMSTPFFQEQSDEGTTNPRLKSAAPPVEIVSIIPMVAKKPGVLPKFSLDQIQPLDGPGAPAGFHGCPMKSDLKSSPS